MTGAMRDNRWYLIAWDFDLGVIGEERVGMIRKWQDTCPTSSPRGMTVVGVNPATT